MLGGTCWGVGCLDVLRGLWGAHQGFGGPRGAMSDCGGPLVPAEGLRGPRGGHLDCEGRGVAGAAGPMGAAGAAGAAGIVGPQNSHRELDFQAQIFTSYKNMSAFQLFLKMLITSRSFHFSGSIRSFSVNLDDFFNIDITHEKTSLDGS